MRVFLNVLSVVNDYSFNVRMTKKAFIAMYKHLYFIYFSPLTILS